ncbi:uncharacterized protein [Antedon mediterranea]|uniref:uncharacterized protein isoform X2 n=1 Tax=Antedon mediterranea TaxID=105859 RepID=UPI003AF5A833
MEDIPIDDLSPLAMQELSKHLDRAECEDKTWREFAGYAYGATFDNILEIESKPSSPTSIVFDKWRDFHSDITTGHLIKILKKIGCVRAIHGLQRLYQEKQLGAPSKNAITPSTSTCSSPIASLYSSGQSSQPITPSSNSYSPSTSLSSYSSIYQDPTILLSYSSSMLHDSRINDFTACLQNNSVYRVQLDQIKASAWNMNAKQAQLYEKFKDAAFVICLIDEEYVKEAQGMKPSTELHTNTRFINELMAKEFAESSNVNSRFLPYLLDARMSKVFPPYLDNPPLGPYEHFQGVLAKELEKLQKLQLEKLQLENHMRLRELRIKESRQLNINNAHIDNVHVDDAVRSNSDSSSQPLSIIRRNRNYTPETEQSNNVAHIRTNLKKNRNFDKFRKFMGNKRKPCKATDTPLIVHLKKR